MLKLTELKEAQTTHFTQVLSQALFPRMGDFFLFLDMTSFFANANVGNIITYSYFYDCLTIIFIHLSNSTHSFLTGPRMI